MTDSPDRYRRVQRHARWKILLVMVAVFVAATLLFGQFLENYQTHQVVSGHNTELAQIKSLTKTIARKQAQHEQTNIKIAQLTGQLKADSTEIAQLTTHSLANQQALCNATPNCALPYPYPGG